MEFWQTVIIVLLTGFFTLAGSVTNSLLAKRSELKKLAMSTLPEKRVETIWEFIRCCGNFYETAFNYRDKKVEHSTFDNCRTKLVDSTHILYIYLSEEQVEHLKELMVEYTECGTNLGNQVGNFTRLRKRIYRYISPMVYPNILRNTG